MHPNTFHLVVAEVGETHFDGAAVSVTLPGTSGEFTVLAHHEPLVTTLKSGTITIKVADGSEKNISISGDGVFECSSGRTIVLL